MSKPSKIVHDISWEALLKVLLFGVGILAVIMLRDILVLMLVVFIFVAAVNPTIIYLQQWMSRTLAVVLFFAILMATLVGIGYVFIPVVIHQINELIKIYPELLDRVRPYLTEGQANDYVTVLNQISNSASNALSSFSTSFISRGAHFFAGVVTFLSGLVMSFYLLLEERNAKEFFHQVLPRHRFQAVYTTVQKISEKMGYWVRGQLILMATIATANFVLYLIFGVPTALALALWAGFCEVIPYIGPWLGMLPAVLILLISGNFIGALFVFLISVVVIQQLEASFVVPRVMGKAVGLSPVFVILAIIIGAKLFGVLGAIIAVPAAATVSVVIQEWPSLRKIWEAAPTAEEAV